MMVDRSSQLIEAFKSIAEGVDDWSRSNYSIGVCSPLEGSERSLTITVKKLYYTGELTVMYDATGFNLTGCDSDWVSMGNNCRDMGAPATDGDGPDGDTDGDAETGDRRRRRWRRGTVHFLNQPACSFPGRST